MTSTHHAVFVRVGKGILVIDTSLNGTYVNNRRVTRGLLKPSDVIRFGKKAGESFTFMNQALSKPCETITQKLLASLQCSICMDYLVFPTELSPCSHLFCHPCLSTKLWDSCPRCATKTNSYKLSIKFNLVDIIASVIRLITSSHCASAYFTRHSACKSILVEQQSQLANLRRKVELCHDDPFLLVSQTWTDYERLKFKRGIAKYSSGEAREYFCWLIRLTAHWVQFDGNQTDLNVAAKNLDIAQDALLRFIYMDPTAV